jgi:hypothetical protein
MTSTVERHGRPSCHATCRSSPRPIRDLRYTNRWFEAQAADAAARKAESERVEAYYSEQARLCEEAERAGK